MIEQEKTYLAASIPDDLNEHERIDITDSYIPPSANHPVLRLRKKGNSYQATKKEPTEDDKSEQREQTINLTKKEYEALLKAPSNDLSKTRYYYDWNDRTTEIDVFHGDLDGLVLVDIEFETAEDKADAVKPGFCLAEVTQDEFIAGGMLCSTSYDDIKDKLETYGYEPL